MIRSILIVGALAVGVGSVMAQNDPIATRKATMKKVSEANAQVTKITKGEAPWIVIDGTPDVDALAGDGVPGLGEVRPPEEGSP